MGARVGNEVRGRKRPLDEAEKQRIIYFLRETEEGNLDIAKRRFQRDLETLRRIAREAGIDTSKFTRQ
jgi:hypothetical protein